MSFIHCIYNILVMPKLYTKIRDKMSLYQYFNRNDKENSIVL